MALFDGQFVRIFQLFATFCSTLLQLVEYLVEDPGELMHCLSPQQGPGVLPALYIATPPPQSATQYCMAQSIEETLI